MEAIIEILKKAEWHLSQDTHIMAKVNGIARLREAIEKLEPYAILEPKGKEIRDE